MITDWMTVRRALLVAPPELDAARLDASARELAARLAPWGAGPVTRVVVARVHPHRTSDAGLALLTAREAIRSFQGDDAVLERALADAAAQLARITRYRATHAARALGDHVEAAVRWRRAVERGRRWPVVFYLGVGRGFPAELAGTAITLEASPFEPLLEIYAQGHVASLREDGEVRLEVALAPGSR